MRRRAADDRSETDHGIVLTALRHLLRNDGDLECPRHPCDVDIRVCRLVPTERIECAAEKLIGDEFVEPSDDNAEL